jgi:hypothetical protein
MLQFQQQGIECALVDLKKISADLLYAPCVLRTISASVPCRTSDFSPIEPTFWLTTGNMTHFLLESNR